MSSTAHIACQQFNIQGAGEEIYAVSALSDVFAPPHHGPRNVPITVKPSDSEYSYTHFPIVRTGRYAIYLETPGIFRGMVYGGQNQNTRTGTEIETERTDPGDCQFHEAYVSVGPIIFNQNDPQPVALRFSNKGQGDKPIRYIVSLVED
ncbi:MAG: hypothetical protein AAGD38_12265 [Acidobacteriota bacterium]